MPEGVHLSPVIYFQECPSGQFDSPSAEWRLLWVCFVLPFLLWLPVVTVSTQEVAWGLAPLYGVCCENVKAQTENIVLCFQVSAKLVTKAISPILGPQTALLGLRISHKIISLFWFSFLFPSGLQPVKNARLEAGDFYIVVNSTDTSHL